jgi:hypothetical protein
MLCVKINGEQFMEISNIFLITCQAQGASLTIKTLLHKIMELSASQKVTTSPCTLFIFNLQGGNQILK